MITQQTNHAHTIYNTIIYFNLFLIYFHPTEFAQIFHTKLLWMTMQYLDTFMNVGKLKYFIQTITVKKLKTINLGRKTQQVLNPSSEVREA